MPCFLHPPIVISSFESTLQPYKLLHSLLKLIRSIMENTWKVDVEKNKNRALNYWWGISAGVLEVVCSHKLLHSLLKFIQRRNPSYDIFRQIIHFKDIFRFQVHDSRSRTRPPEGCVCIEDSVYICQGLRILGLGGSMRYKNKRGFCSFLHLLSMYFP